MNAFREDPDNRPEEPGQGGDGRRDRKIRIWLLSILLILLLLVSASVAVLLPLYQSYMDSYTDIDIITRDEEYSRPSLPTDLVMGTAEGTEPPFDSGDVTEPPLPPVTGGEEDDPPQADQNGIYYVKQKDPDIENILVLGTDSRNLSTDRGRTDSMIVVSFNKRSGEIKLISLLRDIYAPIEGHDWNRLNTAYAYGGAALCINTINDLFGLDIQRFVVVNLAGTKDFIDSCGGVDIALTAKELDYLTNYETHRLTQNPDGTYHLDGSAALAYMRIRKIDSDFKRTERQRKTIMALYAQVTQKKNIAEIYNLVREGFKLIKTNIKLSETLDLAKEVLSLGSSLKLGSDKLPYGSHGDSWNYATTPGGASVIAVDFDKSRAYLEELIYG